MKNPWRTVLGISRFGLGLLCSQDRKVKFKEGGKLQATSVQP